MDYGPHIIQQANLPGLFCLLPQRALSCSVYGYSLATLGVLPGFKREMDNTFLMQWCTVAPLAVGVVVEEIFLLLILGPLDSGP